jgi:hypothetical protein
MSSKILVYDVETTAYKINPDKMNSTPFSPKNWVVLHGLKFIDEEPITTTDIKVVQDAINISKMVVGANIKFDLHWARRSGIDISNISVWDCLIAEFLFSRQRLKMSDNSLRSACERYGLTQKLDIVKTEYWDKKIDTDEIPLPVLREYLEGDLISTEELFKHQYERFRDDN